MNKLTPRKDGSFRILQLTDLHYGHSQEEDDAIARLIAEHAQKADPDLIVVTGDLISAPDYLGPDPALYPEGGRIGYFPGDKNAITVWRSVCALLEKTGCPWTFVFGNHDEEGNADKETLLRAAMDCPNCLASDEGNEPGRQGDHVLNVGDARLFFIDSGRQSDIPGTGRWPWVKAGQIDWFRRKIRKKPSGAPALVFLHIPLPEAENLSQTKGRLDEAICAPEFNSGFFSAMVEEDNVQGVFFGHDHLNEGEGELCGIRLAYGRSFGFDGYCLEKRRDGARLIVLNADGTLKTTLL